MHNHFHRHSETWPKLFAELLGQQALADTAHDPNHIRRVVTNARRLALAEGANWSVVMPAAWLHDCVAVLHNRHSTHAPCPSPSA